jgi:transcriptional regulator with XRE-family HTH domain
MLAKTPKQRLAKLHVVKRRADDLDQAIGRRVRARRLECGISQSALAEQIGLTFQQVQKYEKGTNRIGAGRLVKIAAALDTSVSVLAGSIDITAAATIGERLTTSKFGLRLAQAALKLTSKRKLGTLVDMAESLVS